MQRDFAAGLALGEPPISGPSWSDSEKAESDLNSPASGVGASTNRVRGSPNSARAWLGDGSSFSESHATAWADAVIAAMPSTVGPGQIVTRGGSLSGSDSSRARSALAAAALDAFAAAARGQWCDNGVAGECRPPSSSLDKDIGVGSLCGLGGISTTAEGSPHDATSPELSRVDNSLQSDAESVDMLVVAAETFAATAGGLLRHAAAQISAAAHMTPNDCELRWPLEAADGPTDIVPPITTAADFETPGFRPHGHASFDSGSKTEFFVLSPTPWQYGFHPQGCRAIELVAAESESRSQSPPAAPKPPNVLNSLPTHQPQREYRGAFGAAGAQAICPMATATTDRATDAALAEKRVRSLEVELDAAREESGNLRLQLFAAVQDANRSKTPPRTPRTTPPRSLRPASLAQDYCFNSVVSPYLGLPSDGTQVACASKVRGAGARRCGAREARAQLTDLQRQAQELRSELAEAVAGPGLVPPSGPRPPPVPGAGGRECELLLHGAVESSLAAVAGLGGHARKLQLMFEEKHAPDAEVVQATWRYAREIERANRHWSSARGAAERHSFLVQNLFDTNAREQEVQMCDGQNGPRGWAHIVSEAANAEVQVRTLASRLDVLGGRYGGDFVVGM